MGNIYKICKVCRNNKSIKEFHADKTTTDGFRGKCKTCMYEDVKLWREQNPKKYQECRNTYREKHKKDAKRYRERNPEKVREYMQKYRKDNPEKVAASKMVKCAIDLDLLKKPNRCDCGNNLDVVAHHEDYYKPLSIMWLCKPCHWEVHNIG